MTREFICLFIFFFSTFSMAKSPMTYKFNHFGHVQKVFIPSKFECTQCHNIEKINVHEFKTTTSLETKTFKLSNKEMCHQCHQGGNMYPLAPKECYTCHDTSERLGKIIPLDHNNANWKSSHAKMARTDSLTCANCHSNNQCIKCHSARNPVTNQNHSRNYRLFHSIEARMNPGRCDSCHTENYCIQCHLGGIR